MNRLNFVTSSGNATGKKRKSSVAGRLVPALPLVLVSLALSGRAEQQEIRESHDLQPGATVSLENTSGDIKVISWREQRAEIIATKIGPRDQLDDVTVSIMARPSRLEIRTRYPARGKSQVSVNYELRLPRIVNIDGIRSVSGDIEISEIDGRVVARSVSGSIAVRGVAQDLDLKSISGSVTVANTGGRTSISATSGPVEVVDVAGDLEVKGVSGDISIRRVRGRIEAETVSGDVGISESSAATVRASTVSGNISFSGSLHPEERYELKSFSGNVEAVLPGNSSFDLEASTFSGSLESDFEIKIQGRMEKRSIRGTVGQGGAILELSSFSGTVRLRKGL